MKFLTFNSLSCAIWLFPANFNVKPKLTSSHITAKNTTIRANQTRVRFNDAMRWKFEFTSFIGNDTEASEVREGLGRLKNELVFMPVWVDETGITSDITPGLTTIYINLPPVRFSNYFVILDSLRRYEIVQVTAVNPTNITVAVGPLNPWLASDCIICPLLAGRFEPRPVLTDASDIVSEAQVTFVEDCDTLYKLSPIVSDTVTVGPTISQFTASPLWYIRPSFESQTDSTEVDISNDPIGFYRRMQHTVYPQAVRRSFEYTFVCTDRTMIGRIEYMFSLLGSTEPFFMPTWRGDLRLAASIIAPTNQIIVANVTYSDPAFNTTPGKGFIVLSDSTRIQPAHVTVVAGGTLTCETNVIGQWSIGLTQISDLVLVTMVDSSLQWDYDSGQVASVKIKMIEVTEEYSIAATRLSPIYLYKFTHKVPNPQQYRFTSDEGAAVVPGDGTYLPGPFSHNSVKLSLDPTSDEAQIESYDFIGNPLSLITKHGAYGLNGKLICEIIETQRSNLSATTKIFWGTAVQSDPEGNKFTVTFRALDSVLEQKSRMVFQRQCVWDLYGPGCTLNPAFFRVASNVSSIIGTAVYVTHGNTYPVNRFAYGYMETPGKTDLYEVRSITWSDPFPGNIGVPVLIQTGRPFLYVVPGDLVYYYFGCSKRYIEDCQNVFGNRQNFGGEPFIPIDPPNVIGVTTKQGTGGGGKGGGGGK